MLGLLHHNQVHCSMIHVSEFLLRSFKKSLEYLTREAVQVFILLMRFLLQNLILIGFLVFLRCSFLTFLSSQFARWHPISISPGIRGFLFLRKFLCFSHSAVWFFLLFLLFSFFTITSEHFSIPISFLSWL